MPEVRRSGHWRHTANGPVWVQAHDLRTSAPGSGSGPGPEDLDRLRAVPADAAFLDDGDDEPLGEAVAMPTTQQVGTRGTYQRWATWSGGEFRAPSRAAFARFVDDNPDATRIGVPVTVAGVDTPGVVDVVRTPRGWVPASVSVPVEDPDGFLAEFTTRVLGPTTTPTTPTATTATPEPEPEPDPASGAVAREPGEGTGRCETCGQFVSGDGTHHCRAGAHIDTWPGPPITGWGIDNAGSVTGLCTLTVETDAGTRSTRTIASPVEERLLIESLNNPALHPLVAAHARTVRGCVGPAGTADLVPVCHDQIRAMGFVEEDAYQDDDGAEEPVTGSLIVQTHNGDVFTHRIPTSMWPDLFHNPDRFWDTRADYRLIGGTASRELTRPVARTGIERVGYGTENGMMTIIVDTAAGRLSAPGSYEDYLNIRYGPNPMETVSALFGPDARVLAPGHPVSATDGRCGACGVTFTGSTFATSGRGHRCEGPASNPGPHVHEVGTTVVTSTYDRDSRTVTTTGRWGATTRYENVSVGEFNRFTTEPELMLAVWETGSRVDHDRSPTPTPALAPNPAPNPAPAPTGGGGGLPRPPEMIRNARRIVYESQTGGISEWVRLPSNTAIRNQARVEVPFVVETVGRLSDNPTEAAVRVHGHVEIRRNGRRLEAVNIGRLEGGTVEQQDRMAQTITSIIQAQSPRTAFPVMRRAIHAAAGRLEGRSEASAAAQARHQQAWEQTTRSDWAQDPDPFQEHYETARAAITAGQSPLPYRRTNALGGLGDRGSGRGFGVELEFNFPNSMTQDARAAARQAIVADMRAEGLLPPEHQRGFHYYGDQQRLGYRQWVCTADSTVTGGEIVSPVLYDTPETWDQLEKVCEIIRRHGGTADHGQVGQHIHVGVGDYDETVENHNRLLSDFKAYEDVLYRLGTNPTRRNHRGTRWCSPNDPIPVAGYTRLREVQSAHTSHNVALNFQSVHGRPADHVEFRHWDGTLDPQIIQAQVLLSLGITEAALAGRNAPREETEPLGAHLNDNPRRRLLEGDAWNESHRSFRQMVDRLFYRDEDKAVATGLFAMNRWQRSR